MNTKIINYIKQQPPIYFKSSKAFWDDEHISKSMLKAHLNTDTDGASRKLDTIQKSVEWIYHCCQNVQNKKLLDLGCGAGIYSELLYDKGFSVTGIDFSKRSIEYAQNHAKETARKIQYYYQDYVNINYENEFVIVILIYCDVFNSCYLNSFEILQNIKYEKYGFWSAEPHIIIQRNQYYKKTKNTLEQYIIITKNDCECFNIWNQIYSPNTFTEELKLAGFKIIDIYDDVKNPLSEKQTKGFY